MFRRSDSPGYSDVNDKEPVRNLEGAAWMVVSAIGFTAHVVLAKVISSDVHPVFLAFIRSLVSFVITLPLLFSGRVTLSTAKFDLVFTRSLFGSFGFICAMLAVWEAFELPLAEFNAISFSRSLFVNMFAAFFLAETVGRARWFAVLVGFFGVLVMALPGYVLPWVSVSSGPTLNWGSLFAILSAVCFAGAIVLVKNLTRYHKPIELLIWANLLSSILLFIPALFFWSWPSSYVWWLIVLMALSGLAAQFCYIKGMSVGDASFLSPMDYLRLPMAVLADWWMIKTFPGPYTWVGATIIIAATLFITIRERMKARAAQRTPPKTT